MKKRDLFIFFGMCLLYCSCNTEKSAINNPTITVNYPSTTKQLDTIENYHGTDISDPYRWLEDDNSDETIAWVTEQNKVTSGYLSQIPFREDISKRLEKLWNYEKYSSPFKEGGKYYYFKNII
jgi:prolyl oligopeptidase